MSLRDLTKSSHNAAESTKFMKAVFAGNLPREVWADFLYQKSLFYNGIESCAEALGLLKDMPELRVSVKLLDDFRGITNKTQTFYNVAALDYYRYIMCLYPNRDKILAHLYTWHMGDLHGGQMIKKMLPGPHTHLDFENRTELISKMRSMLDDNLADEANVAFSWAIKIMEEYDHKLNL